MVAGTGRRTQRAGLLAWLCLLASVLALGCGGSDEPIPGAEPTPGPQGEVEIAVAGPVEVIDPLAARSRAERLVSRQVFEPLVSRERGPFDSPRLRAGILRSIRGSSGGTLWTARLRSGVRFTNGAPLDADAIEANVDRWLASPRGRQLLPDLVATFSPRPGLIRFRLAARDMGFPERLGNSRLGVVAPRAIERAGSGQIAISASGSGPFELREPGPSGALLARNVDWWGSPLGLGPGVDRIILTTVELRSSRVDRLIAGEVEVADQLNPAAANEIATQPLLTERGEGPLRIGLERSVRGIDSPATDQSLADLWVTTLR